MMGWATSYIAKLQQGETISFRPRGQSMVGIISSGQLVTVAPVGVSEISKGDVVLCKVNGRQFLHLVTAVKDGRYQISNNYGHVNGWTGYGNIYGVLVGVGK